MHSVKGALGRPVTGTVALLLVLLVLDAALQPGTMSVAGIGTILTESGAVGLAAVGATFVVLIGDFDLSAGSVLSLVVVTVASIRAPSSGSALGVVLMALAAGCVIGLMNGILVLALRIPAIVVTLAMSFFWAGVALIIMSQPGGAVPLSIVSWVTGDAVLAIPTVYFVFACVAGVWLGLKHTRFGSSLYALGSNRTAAVASGVRVKGAHLGCYVVAGGFYGLAGVFLAGQSGGGDPTVGAALLLPIFTAVIVGGTAFGGGRGGALGSLAGAVILTLISQVLYALHVSTFYTDVFNGAVLLVAVTTASLGDTGLARDAFAAIAGVRRTARPSGTLVAEEPGPRWE